MPKLSIILRKIWLGLVCLDHLQQILEPQWTSQANLLNNYQDVNKFSKNFFTEALPWLQRSKKVNLLISSQVNTTTSDCCLAWSSWITSSISTAAESKGSSSSMTGVNRPASFSSGRAACELPNACSRRFKASRWETTEPRRDTNTMVLIPIKPSSIGLVDSKRSCMSKTEIKPGISNIFACASTSTLS